MLIVSADWEEERIPKALQNLVKRLSVQGNMAVDEEPSIPLEERKLTYAKLADGELPRTPTSINKSISQLLAKNRAKINASNRSEFLYPMSERRRRVQEASNSTSTTSETTSPPPSDTTPTTIDPSELGSCARTDAKPINRDEQMKYDIAKNNEGSLSRTMKASGPKQSEMSAEDEERVTAVRYPALDERLQNLETHFAVRYVPSPPRTLISRLKMLEDHIIKLEKEYPPWAALHFNQPNRGWPPPPRSTPIIVPVSLRSTNDYAHVPTPKIEDTPSSLSKSVSFASEPSESAPGSPSSSNAKPAQKPRNLKSSLHRAVMEKLQVQQAMNEIGGAG
ncbi:hypothetical protein FA13DRAFT_1653236 [Coprinellus micaceus]|uniref:Uncharacterized protein n=1 Tax=Coprinellus micaceus TaxID=71717 RepID=A0A4Y7RPP8_COPMI|nr:hypothetical protein FA13DRAFT_1653236 [Coprinellus micaceus]